MNYSETLEWLYAQLPMFQRVGGAAYKADLNNTHQLMEILKNPEKKFKSIHIAGTNGKGSVSHMLAAVFQKAGYKTGLYTSPHLIDFRERIRLNGEMISEEKVVEFVKNYREEFSGIGLSFFEMSVGLAFHFFASEKVDIAIVETGMGGRLDSTNVIIPELSIITNISFDHVQFLGNDLPAIAGEKAGIIKKNIPVLIGERQSAVEMVFLKKARENDAPLYFAVEYLPPGVNEFSSDLSGSYQQKNIRTVLAACRILEDKGYTLLPSASEALKKVKELTGLRGRWEMIRDNPLTIADTAHNAAGVSEVLEQLRKLTYRQLHIVWGMVGDKDGKTILRMLPKSAIYYFAQPGIPRARDAYEMQREGLSYGLAGKVYNSVWQAYQEALKHAEADDLVFLGGSTFVVAEILTELQDKS